MCNQWAPPVREARNGSGSIAATKAKSSFKWCRDSAKYLVLCTAQRTFQNLIKSRPTVKTVSRKVSLDNDWLRPMRHHGSQRFPHWLRGQNICSSFVCWHWSFESCRAQALQMGTAAVTTANKLLNKVKCFLATQRVVLQARMRHPSAVRCARRHCDSALKNCDLAAAL